MGVGAAGGGKGADRGDTSTEESYMIDMYVALWVFLILYHYCNSYRISNGSPVHPGIRYSCR